MQKGSWYQGWYMKIPTRISHPGRMSWKWKRPYGFTTFLLKAKNVVSKEELQSYLVCLTQFRLAMTERTFSMRYFPFGINAPLH